MLITVDDFVDRGLLDHALFDEQRLKRLHTKGDGLWHIGMPVIGILIVVVRHNPTLERADTDDPALRTDPINLAGPVCHGSAPVAPRTGRP